MPPQSKIKIWIDAWNKSGRVAWHYPKLKKISLNGGKLQNEKDAIQYIASVLIDIR